MPQRVRTAAERRREIQEQAARLGIDEAYIERLVDVFYGRIRTHKQLGPIFDTAIGTDWGPHLAKMKDFWASVALHAGRYSGKPVPAHQNLCGVNKTHFAAWLDLFEQTLIDTAPQAGAVAYFMQRARRIADSLQLAMFGIPARERPNHRSAAEGPHAW